MKNLFRQSSRHQKHRSPSALSAEIQLLEQRTLPTGTVVAAVSSGNLTLTGDNNSNQLTINVTETGITLTGTAGTLIRSGAFSAATQTLVGSNTFRDVTINLDGGNDALTVNLGTDLAVGNLTVRRNLKINGGFGNDSVTVNSATLTSGKIDVGGDLTVDLGAGNDRLTKTLVAAPINVTGNVRIIGGTGNDDVELEALTVGKDLTIDTGSGDDEVFLVDSGTGTDTVPFTATGIASPELQPNGTVRNGLSINASFLGAVTELTGFSFATPVIVGGVVVSASGTQMFRAADGSELSVFIFGEFESGFAGPITNGTFEITGGTGRFSGARGSGAFSGGALPSDGRRPISYEGVITGVIVNTGVIAS